jgi:hypothetical protein
MHKEQRKTFDIIMKNDEFKKGYDDENLYVKQIRVKSDKVFVKLRKTLAEHTFDTVKRVMDAGYCLFRGMDRVRGEFSLAFLVFNLKRVINIVGVQKLIQTIQP